MNRELIGPALVLIAVVLLVTGIAVVDAILRRRRYRRMAEDVAKSRAINEIENPRGIALHLWPRR